MADEKSAAMLQQLVSIYQLLQAHTEQLRQQRAALHKGMADMETTRQAVTEVAKAGSQEALIPLGSGVFTAGTVQANGKLLIDVGAGVVLEKAPADILELIEKKKAELDKIQENLQSEEANAARQITEVAQQIQQLSG